MQMHELSGRRTRGSQMTRIGQTAGLDHVILTPICLFYICTRRSSRRHHAADLEAAPICLALKMCQQPEISLLFDKRAQTKEVAASRISTRAHNSQLFISPPNVTGVRNFQSHHKVPTQVLDQTAPRPKVFVDSSPNAAMWPWRRAAAPPRPLPAIHNLLPTRRVPASSASHPPLTPQPGEEGSRKPSVSGVRGGWAGSRRGPRPDDAAYPPRSRRVFPRGASGQGRRIRVLRPRRAGGVRRGLEALGGSPIGSLDM